MSRCHLLAVIAVFACAAAANAQPGGGLTPASVVQLPSFGVSIDAAGVLSLKRYGDPGGRLRAKRIAAAKRVWHSPPVGEAIPFVGRDSQVERIRGWIEASSWRPSVP